MYYLIGILCALFWMAPDIAAPMDRPVAGTFTQVRGLVTARRAGEQTEQAMKSGASIEMGQILTTGQDGWAQLAFLDGSMVTILSNASLFIKHYSYSPDTERRTAVLKVLDGRTRFIIVKSKGSGSWFRVETDQAMLDVGASDFFICASRAETEVVNMGAQISVRNGSNLAIGSVLLNSNQKTILKENTPPSQPATVPPDQRRGYLNDAAR
jgi:hypothetical protein